MSISLKPSRYLILVDAPVESGMDKIAFSASTGKMMLLDEADSKALASIDASDEGRLRQYVESGFLVDVELDELALQRDLFLQAQNDDSTLSLCIAPTYACNLRCPYCYEEGSDQSCKLMDAKVQDGIVSFVQGVFDMSHYEVMEVQWYGGEPMLGASIIEKLSERLIDFCEGHDILYSAEIITNATLIDADGANMLASKRVRKALVTIDGTRDEMNKRRPAADGSDSFDSALQGAKHLQDAGINVVAMMNADKVNENVYDEACEIVRDRLGIPLMHAKLNDYRRCFGQGDFCEPGFDLYTHKEFAELDCMRFVSEDRSAEDYRFKLSPVPMFCRGQMSRYFVIDALGDVYRSDGYMGNEDHRIFSIFDGFDKETMFANSEYPFDDGMCTECNMLPICKGTCRWERECCDDHPCHPLKHTMRDYLQGWARASLADSDAKV